MMEENREKNALNSAMYDYNAFSSSANSDTFSNLSDRSLSSQNSLIQFDAPSENHSYYDSSSYLSFVDSLTGNKSQQQSDITNFLIDFNRKYKETATSLNDVLNILDNVVSKNVKKCQASTHLKKEDSHQIKRQLEQLQIDNSNLESLLTNEKTKYNDLELQLNNIKIESCAFTEKIKILENNNNKLKKSLNLLQDAMEAQIQEIDAVGKQRYDLIQLINKQADFINVLQKNQNNAKKVTNYTLTQKQPIETEVDDNYIVLISVIKSINNLFPDDINVNGIKDNSTLSPNERIVKIVEYITNNYKQSMDLLSENEKLVHRLEKEKESLKQRAMEALSLLEGELRFISSLPNNVELQKKVFTQGNHIEMTHDEKSMIYTKCARLGRFIENTFGSITAETTDQIFHTDKFEPKKIFDMINTNNMNSSLEQILDGLSNPTDLDQRLLFDMFGAQLFINNILKNHISEQGQRIARNNHEIQKMKIELDNSAQIHLEYDQLNENFKKCQSILMDVRELAGKYVEVDNQTPTVDLVQNALDSVKAIQASNEAEAEILQLKQNVVERMKERNAAVSMIKKERKQNAEETKKLNSSINDLQEQLKASRNELERTVELNNKAQQEINALQSNLETNNVEIEKLKENIKRNEEDQKSVVAEYENKINLLEEKKHAAIKQLDECEKSIESLKKQRINLGKKIERLSIMNRRLSEAKEKEQEKLKEKFTKSINELQSQYQTATSELMKLQKQSLSADTKIQQLTSDFAQANVEKKTLALKLRSLEQKAALEKQSMQSQIHAQITAAQAEQASKISSIKQELDYVLSEISKLVPNEVSNINEAMHLMIEEFGKLRDVQSQFLEISNDIKECQKLIGANDAIKFSIALTEYLKTHQQVNTAEIEAQRKKNIEDMEKIRMESSRLDDLNIQIKRWDTWARRAYRLVRESETVGLDSDSLRMALEEALLASVSQRLVIYRLESLRIQKHLMQRFERRNLMSKPYSHPSLRIAIIIALSAKRILRLSGYVPISIETQQIKKRQSLYRNVSGSPRQPLIPICI